MRRILFIFSVCLVALALPAGAESLTLTDGGSVLGDILKYDDSGVMLRASDETYTNIAWARFSQDALKQLAQDPKIQPFAEPFIEPTEASRPQPATIQVNLVTRLERPENPSLLGGLVKSPVGLFILLVIYAANLFAAYEISRYKIRPVAQVVGLAAVLPVIGPVIFLIMPMWVEPPPAELDEEFTPAGNAPAQSGPHEEIQIAEASWKPQEEKEKKPEPQVYARGKFTFNKRFVETRFAAFIGETPGELAKKYSMEVRTMKNLLAVERILQVGAAEIIFETPTGQVTVPLSDIQEIKLNPKTA